MFKFIIYLLIITFVLKLLNSFFNSLSRLNTISEPLVVSFKDFLKNDKKSFINKALILFGILIIWTLFNKNKLSQNTSINSNGKIVNTVTNKMSALDDYSLSVARASNGTGYVSKHSPAVSRSKFLLDKLSKHFDMPVEQVFNITQNASYTFLKDYKMKISPLQILEAINTLIPTLPKGVKYTEVVALYVTLTGQ